MCRAVRFRGWGWARENPPRANSASARATCGVREYIAVSPWNAIGRIALPGTNTAQFAGLLQQAHGPAWKQSPNRLWSPLRIALSLPRQPGHTDRSFGQKRRSQRGAVSFGGLARGRGAFAMPRCCYARPATHLSRCLLGYDNQTNGASPPRLGAVSLLRRKPSDINRFDFVPLDRGAFEFSTASLVADIVDIAASQRLLGAILDDDR